MTTYLHDTGVSKAGTRDGALDLLGALEPLIVLIVGVVVLYAEWLPKWLVISALILLFLPLVVRLAITGRVSMPSLANIPILLLFLLLAGTYWVTSAWRYSAPQMVRMLWGMAVYLAIVNWLNPLPVAQDAVMDKRQKLAVRVVIATIAFLGLGIAFTTVGLLGMQPTYKIRFIGALLDQLPKLHVNGIDTFNSNNVAGVVILFAPMALALALGPLQLRQHSAVLWLTIKVSALILALFFCGALLLTQTRGAWLALGCSLLLFLVLLGRRGQVLLALLLVVGVAGVNLIGPTKFIDELTVRGPASVEAGILIQDRNLAARFVLWKRAIHGIADAPLTGMGLGAFQAVSQQPYPQVEDFVPDSDMTHVHNIILQAGVDFGVPGIVALVSLLILIGHLVVRLVRQTEAPGLFHTWSLGLLASFVAFLVFNMSNVTPLGSLQGVAVWFLFGLCGGASESIHLQQQPVDEKNNFPLAMPPQERGADNEWIEWEQRAWAATAGSSKK